MYSVVEFTATNQVDVVPSSWINNGQCWYPNYNTDDRIQRAIKKNEAPNQTFFTLFDVRVFKSYSKFILG